MKNVLFWVLFPFCWGFTQQITIRGMVQDGITQKPIVGATITLGQENLAYHSDASGSFVLHTHLQGQHILLLSAPNYINLKIPLLLEGQALQLGNLNLERDIRKEQTDNLLTLTTNELADDQGSLSSSVGLLQATRDVFLSRAAFDFGQAFFRIRGYDAREGQVLINGITMNKIFTGRPEWNNWGGLNDVSRNQQYTHGLAASTATFGGLLGSTQIDMRPSGLRKGTRLSSSFANRTYAGRFMGTHSSGVNQKGWAYTLSGSRRWAKQGYINGTLYDAYSLFGAVEYKLNAQHSIVATGIFTKNRRGRSAAITQEVQQLTHKQYNPYWGYQNGKIRNARERNIAAPIFMLNHYYKTKNLSLNTAIAYQTGTHSRSRLGYYNAPNPDPTYYRYLPSFYINNRIGADFTNAALAREGFLSQPQINWASLYTANTSPENNGKAAYILYDDVVADRLFNVASAAEITLSKHLNLAIGLNYKQLKSNNYAEVKDLLGAMFHVDEDPFTSTRNNIKADPNVVKGDTFNYNYHLHAKNYKGFAQLQLKQNQWSGFLAGQFSGVQYQREGLFKNERFLNNSLGPSEALNFTNWGLKAGITRQITARHWLSAHGAIIHRPPSLQNTFINPRENNQIVPHLQQETLSTIDLNYYVRLPDLTARLSTFYSRFQNTTDINFFFVDAGLGSDFVQEVITNLDQLHMGIELGVAYQISPQVKLSLVTNLGKYLYASNPNISINFDTAGADEDLINPEGNIDLGVAQIKNLKLAQGPQTAYSIGVEYRDPKYWWLGATANYLADNYANISSIIRTPSFLIDPDTGAPFPEATPENVAPLLRQKALDNFYLLNLVGGKSWLVNSKYISCFASINNVFDQLFRTGGYEQSRNGNFGQLQQDQLRNDPSFAPKYWYGFGRSFFLNLAVSF